MKKRILFSLCIALVLAFLPLKLLILPASAEETEYTSGNYTYTVLNGDATITSYKDFFASEVVVPDTLDGYPVTSIGKNAFDFCSDLVNVELPKSITSIGEQAFYDCSSLVKITIPKSVLSVGSNAIRNSTVIYCYKNTAASEYCEAKNNQYYVYIDGDDSESIITGKFKGDTSYFTWNLDKRTGKFELNGSGRTLHPTTIDAPWYKYRNYIVSATLSDGITSLEGSIFSGSRLLESINIPSGVTAIKGNAFEGCVSLKEIVIPDSVNNIESGVFANCFSLESITLSKNIKKISSNMFAYCNSLVNITIPNGVTSVDNSAFYACTSLKNIIIPDGVKNIGELAFDGCTSLESVFIPNTVDSIQHGAFFNCSSLKSINLSNNITTIEKNTFSNCASLENITIPDSVSTIGSCAFSRCFSLKDVFFGENVKQIENGTFLHCTSLVNIVLPNKLERIENSAFSGCSLLEEITIPNTVVTLGDWAFYECESLEKITIGSGVRFLGENIFYRCNSLKDVIVYSRTIYINSSSELNDNATIYAFVGSKAEIEANTFGRNFIDLETIHTHSWLDATCTNPETCIICDSTKGNALGHNYSNETTVKATTTKNGHVFTECSVCGANETKTIIYYPKTVKLSYSETTYNGKIKKPSVVVKNSKGKAISSKYYTVGYDGGRKNAGTYKVTVKFKGDYSGSKTLYFKIKPISISKCTAKLSTTTYTYNGKVKTPSVTVKNANGTILKKNVHYTVKYASGRKNAGKYKVTITMKGNYSGTKTLYFEINPGKTSIKKVTGASKSIKVSITEKTTQVSGYQIQYSTSKKFTSAKTKTISSAKTTSTTIKSLKAKKTYYVRVRTYKTVNGKKYYSGWSSYKYAKTK